jgi:hypothetical protein
MGFWTSFWKLEELFLRSVSLLAQHSALFWDAKVITIGTLIVKQILKGKEWLWSVSGTAEV